DEDDGGDSEGGESSSDDSDSEKATHEEVSESVVVISCLADGWRMHDFEVQALRKGCQLKLEDVLNGLPNWLDRLFEGSIRRYYIPEWPDNLK
ncbi:unnamed protein product, partial [Anisakis simplex]|uniref:DnaJ homolog subfamily C member 16 (inferred by orthology to a human protein) n=1 Tax=Anisakis simplex TaxID=6269 RepID=A0A0M3JMW8_ANISI